MILQKTTCKIQFRRAECKQRVVVMRERLVSFRKENSMSNSEIGLKSPIQNESDFIAEYEKTPCAERFPLTTSYDILKNAGVLFNKDTALIQLITAEVDEQPVGQSFGELSDKITQVANLLHQLDVKRNDTVSILLPSIMENQLAIWGSQATGIANPINHFLNVDHIIEIMNEVKSKVLITLAPDESLDLTNKVRLIIEKVPSLTTVLTVKSTPNNQNSNFDYKKITVLDFADSITKQASKQLIADAPIADNIAMYFHTGGTTGRPKVAKLQHSGIAFIAQIYCDFNRHHGRSTTLNPLPLFHVFGAIAASLGMFIQGRTVVMMTADGFRHPNVVKNWWYFVERYQVVFFPTVPTIMTALLNQESECYDLSCLKYVGSGSAPLPVELKKAFEKKYLCEVTNGYGMTEVSCLVTRIIPGFELPEDTVGNPIPYTSAVAAHVANNKLIKICDPGEAGVILVKGPHVFAGYFDDKDNANAWVEKDWFNTGDIGVVDNNGHLRLTGRAKDLIIRGGHNIDPQLIENALLGHEAISQAVAVGQPDSYAGEVPVAYVVLKPNKIVTEESLLTYCGTCISERAAIPKRIEIIKEIPVTAVGKVFKPTLRNFATEFAVHALLHHENLYSKLSAKFDATRGQIVNIEQSQPESQAIIVELLKGLPIKVEFK